MYEDWYQMRAAQQAAFDAAEEERAALEQAEPPAPSPRATTLREATEALRQRLHVERSLMIIASTSSAALDDGELSLSLLGEITAPKVDRLINSMHRRPNAERVSVSIDTIGGFISHAERLYAALEAHPGTITTIAMRNCNSAGILVFGAGDRRIAMPEARFVFHRTTDTSQTEAQVSDAFEQIQIGRRAGVPYQRVAEWQAGNVVMSADEARAAGLVHEVWDEAAVAALEQIPDDYEIRSITGVHARLAMPAAVVASLAGAIRARRPIGCLGLPRAMIAAAVGIAGIGEGDT